MRFRIAALCLAILAAGLWKTWTFTSAYGRGKNTVTIYDPNPEHIWNRLHAAIFIRDDLPGSELVPDSLDPPLWYHTRHLLVDPSYRQVLRILDEFLQTHAETLIHDPLKRATLQRDLWAVFDWSVERQPVRPGEGYEAAKHELQVRLADVMRRLALTPDEIESLPDNYAQALDSGEFAKEYDPTHAERAFLPPDLFQAHGPWVELEDPTDPEPMAEQHFYQFSGRSSFMIFLRLPEGRRATFEYLKTLWNSPKPLMPSPNFAPGQDAAPHPDLPQFPAGTQVALVRQMTLFDKQGKLVNTPITESVQLRVYHSVERSSTATVGTDRVAKSGQDFYEIRLSRPQFFANKAGGLRAVGRDEREFAVFGFPGPDEGLPGHYALLAGYEPVVKECAQCHSQAGVNSVNSRSRLLKPHPMQQDFAQGANEPRWWQDPRTLSWKQNRDDWGLLSRYWQTTNQ